MTGGSHMRDQKAWTHAEDEYLRKNYNGRKSLDAIAQALDRTVKSVASRSYRIGIADYIMDNYYDDPTIKICLNCPYPRCRPTICELVPKNGRTVKGPRKKKVLA